MDIPTEDTLQNGSFKLEELEGGKDPDYFRGLEVIFVQFWEV
jgi:hypothetical protein